MGVLTIIKLSPDDYMKIIAGKPIQVIVINLKPGCNYRLFNRATGTWMIRYLRAIVDEYTYWE